MGQQPHAQRLDGDQAALSDLDALEGARPERVVNRRPAQSGQPRRLARQSRCTVWIVPWSARNWAASSMAESAIEGGPARRRTDRRGC
jgi:hypothetical protein